MDPLSAVASVGSLIAGVAGVATIIVNLKERYDYAPLHVSLCAGSLWTVKAALEAIEEWRKTTRDSSKTSEQLDRDLTLSLEACACLISVIDRKLKDTNLTNPSFFDRARFVSLDAIFKDFSANLDTQVRGLQLLLQVYQCRTLTERTEKLQRRDTRKVFRQVEESTFSLHLEDQDLADAVSILSEEPSVNFEVDHILLNSPLYRKVYGDRYLKRAQRLSRTVISPRNSLQPTPEEVPRVGHKRNRSKGSNGGGESFLANIPGGVPFLGIPFQGERVEDDDHSSSEPATSIKDPDEENIQAQANVIASIQEENTANDVGLSQDPPSTSPTEDSSKDLESTEPINSVAQNESSIGEEPASAVTLKAKEPNALTQPPTVLGEAAILPKSVQDANTPGTGLVTQESARPKSPSSEISHLYSASEDEGKGKEKEGHPMGMETSESGVAGSANDEGEMLRTPNDIESQHGEVAKSGIAPPDVEHKASPEAQVSDTQISQISEHDHKAGSQTSLPSNVNTPTIVEPQSQAVPRIEIPRQNSVGHNSNSLNIDFGADLDFGIATPSSDHIESETTAEPLTPDSARPTDAMISELRKTLYQRPNDSISQSAESISNADPAALSTPASPIRRSASIKRKPTPSRYRPRTTSSPRLTPEDGALESQRQSIENLRSKSFQTLSSPTATGSPTKTSSPRLPISNVDLKRLSVAPLPSPQVNINAPQGPPPPVPKREPPPIPPKPSDIMITPPMPSSPAPPIPSPARNNSSPSQLPLASPPAAPSIPPPPIPTSPRPLQNGQVAAGPIDLNRSSSKIVRPGTSNRSTTSPGLAQVNIPSSGDSVTGAFSNDTASILSASTSPTTRSSGDWRSADSNSYQTNITSALSVPSAMSFANMGIANDPESRQRERIKISGAFGKHFGTSPDGGANDGTGKKLPLRRSFARLSGRFGSDRTARIKLLHEASRDGSVPLLESCLQESSAKDVQTSLTLPDETNNRTPLMRAATNGHIECMERLVKAGADFATADRSGRIALHHAIEGGQPEAVRWMAERFRLVAAYPGYPMPPGPLEITNVAGQGSLAIAAGAGRADIIEILISAGAQLEGGDRQNRTALFAAIQSQNFDAVSALISHGANFNHLDNTKDTPLMCAARVGPSEVAALLLETGADRSAKDENGDLALHHAARSGQLEVLELLYMSIDDLEVKNNIGERPLHVAAGANSNHVVKALLRIGCNPNAWTEPPAKRKKSLPLASAPLHYACRGGHFDVANDLVMHGALVTSNLEDGTSPLMLAVSAVDLATVLLLLETGVSVNAQTSADLMTALHMAATKPGSLDIVKQLLDFGANPRMRNKKSETPVAYAINCKTYDQEAVQYLSKHNYRVIQREHQALRRNQLGYNVPSVPSHMFYGGQGQGAFGPGFVNVDAGRADPALTGYFGPQQETAPADAPPAYHTLPPRSDRGKPA